MGGSVPVELVVRIEKTDLPVAAISQGVSIFSGLQEGVALPDLDADPVVEVTDVMWLRQAVSRHRQQFETDCVVVTCAVAVAGWKVAVYTAFDLLAFGQDRDGLCHGERAAFLYGDQALERENALAGECCWCSGEGSEQCCRMQEPAGRPHR